MFGLEDLTEPQDQKTGSIAYFMLTLMQISAQAKILHWQTDFDREHRHFGTFFEEFTEQMDTLVESIAGKYGKENLKFGQAGIMVYDYDQAREKFFELVDDSLCGTFRELFDRDKDSELYNLADNLLDLRNKVQYLLQFKP